MRDLSSLSVEDLDSAYIGKTGRCACGCSGTYYRKSPVIMKWILKRVQRRAVRASHQKVEPLHYYQYKNGAEMWAYDTKRHLIRIETLPPG